jgi:hypothetical protein
MPFENPIVANEDLIRTGIKSPNYTASTDAAPGTGWRIAQDGSAEFSNLTVRGNSQGDVAGYNSLSANNQFFYKGDELTVLLNRRAKGLIAYGTVPNITYTKVGAGSQPLLELQCVLEAGRSYRLYTNEVKFTTNTTNEVPRIVMGYTDDGTQPTIGVGTTVVAEVTPMTNVFLSREMSHKAEAIYNNTANKTLLRVLLAFDSVFANTVIVSAYPVVLAIEDIGLAIPSNTGINRFAGGASKAFKSFETGSIGTFQSYTGAAVLFSTTYAYQGQSPFAGNGNMFSFIFFNFGAAPINDLVGVLTADVVYMDLYLYYPHWYNSSGGINVLGYHDPAAGGTSHPNVVEYTYPGRNIGQWLSIKGSLIDFALRGNTLDAFMLGPGPTTSFTYYGYAQLASFRAGYYK